MDGNISDHIELIARLASTPVRKAVPYAADAPTEAPTDESDPAPATHSSNTDVEEPDELAEDVSAEQSGVEKRIIVEIAKAVDEEQTVTGVVLQPEVVDGQLDIIGAAVIRKDAFKFLADFNVRTKLGVQHTTFKAKRLALAESFIAPMDMVIGNKLVKQGSWVMTVKILDKALWKKVKDGDITGFSIGGKAKVIQVKNS